MPPLAILLILISTFLHAGWNLLLRSRRDDDTVLRASMVIVVVGLGPALLAEFLGTRFPAQVWAYLVITGIFEALYNLGLSRGYQTGEFSFVYPLARALPILILAGADVIRGQQPSPLAWLGMVLVSVGCMLIPLDSVGRLTLARYWNRAAFWVVVTAIGTVGYTLVDKLAAELIEPGPDTAARYMVYSTAFTVVAYWLIFKLMRQPLGRKNGGTGWRGPAIAGAAMFGAYWLVLWSYQLSQQTSYVVALRQFSIVIGVVIGVFAFNEPAPLFRIGAAMMIAVGIAGIALAG